MEVENDPELSRSLAAFGAPNLKYYRFGSRTVRTTLGQPMTPAQRVPPRGMPAEQRPVPPGLRPRGADGQLLRPPAAPQGVGVSAGGAAGVATLGSRTMAPGLPSAAKMFPLLGSALSEAADIAMSPQWRAPADNNLPDFSGIEVGLPAGVAPVPRPMVRAPDLRTLAAQAAQQARDEQVVNQVLNNQTPTVVQQPVLGQRAPFAGGQVPVPPAFAESQPAMPPNPAPVPMVMAPPAPPEPVLQAPPPAPVPAPAQVQPQLPPQVPPMMQPAPMMYPGMMPPVMAGMPYGYMYPGMAGPMPGMWPPVMMHPGMMGMPAYPGQFYPGYPNQPYPNMGPGGMAPPPPQAVAPPEPIPAQAAAPPAAPPAEPPAAPPATRVSRIRLGAAHRLTLAGDRPARRAAIAADLMVLARNRPAAAPAEPEPPAAALPPAAPGPAEPPPDETPRDLAALALDLAGDAEHQAAHPITHVRALLGDQEPEAAPSLAPPGLAPLGVATPSSFFAPLHLAHAEPPVAEPEAAPTLAAAPSADPAEEPPAFEESVAFEEPLIIEAFPPAAPLAHRPPHEEPPTPEPVAFEAAMPAPEPVAAAPVAEELIIAAEPPPPAEWRSSFFSTLRALSTEAETEVEAAAKIVTAEPPPIAAVPVAAMPAAAAADEPAPTSADFLANLAAPVLAARALSAKATGVPESVPMAAPVPEPTPEPPHAPPEPPSGAAFFAALRELDAVTSPPARAPVPPAVEPARAAAPPAPEPEAPAPGGGLFDSLRRDPGPAAPPQKPLRDLLRKL